MEEYEMGAADLHAKYKPESINSLKCHRWQAQRLREWIQEFTSASRNRTNHGMNSKRSNGIHRSTDYDDSSSMSDASDTPEVARKCVLLTGPPGVGKTSLVYCVAKELKMHVIESHASEKRDFRLFSTLKLANQKGKINPIARLFQVAQNKQTCHIGESQEHKQQRHSKRKRRKLDQPDGPVDQDKVACNGNSKVTSNNNNNQQLSLSGDSSIVLFDDIDVVFEEDGPFLKSLVEFIGESKRPVILTATKSIDYLKDTLVHFEHIHLDRPAIEDYVRLLQEVCTRENYHKLATVTNCKILARKSNGDLRQCLNRIHFYGEEQASSENQDDASDIPNVTPDLSRLSGHHLLRSENEDVMRSSQKTIIADEEATIIYNELGAICSDPLDCYHASSCVDLMDRALNIVDRPTLLEHWLGGVPSYRNEEPTSGHDLGEQIRQSIVEMTCKLFRDDIMSKGELQKHRRDFDSARSRAREMGQRINLRIKGRIEPPERDFYIDIVPMLGETIKLEADRKRECALSRTGKGCYSPSTTAVTTTTMSNGGGGDRPRSPVTGSGTILSRRTRRVQSYLDLIGVYFEQEEFLMVEDTLLTPARLTTGPDDSVHNEQATITPTTTKHELLVE